MRAEVLVLLWTTHLHFAKALLPFIKTPSVKLRSHSQAFSTLHHACVPSELELSDLSRKLRKTYHEGGTDGALEWVLSPESDAPQEPKILQWNVSGSDLVKAASLVSASKPVVSGIINALLGACCSLSLDNRQASVQTQVATLTGQILKSYEEISKLKPTLLSLCLAYTTLRQASCGNVLWKGLADQVLQKANDLHRTQSEPSKGTTRHAGDLLTANEKKRLWVDYEIKILSEAEASVVVSKPSGMVCYHDDNQHRAGRKRVMEPSLEDVLLQCCLISTLNEKGRGFVHRIDRGTSGCVVLAKTNEMHAQLVAQFFLRRVKKTYQALVTVGDDSPLIKNSDKGIAKHAIGGKPAQSAYLVAESHGTNVASLQIKPLQGRKHQIRIHCSKVLRSPILLDPLYGGEAIMFQMKNSSLLKQMRAKQRFCLHAQHISIPGHGIDIVDEAPLWWSDVIGEIEASDRGKRSGVEF